MTNAGTVGLVERMADHVVLLDGGLSTALEEQGHRLDDSLWTASRLLDAPDDVAAAHAAFVAAGAEVLITASYQVSEQGFEAAGPSADEARAALVASVTVARAASAAAGTGAGAALVAASVGPYGAILADGSEYRGRYGLGRDELVAFHAPRIDVLVAAGPDALAVETIPDLDEAAAVASVLASLGDRAVPTWVSFCCGADGRLRSGDDVAEAAELVARVPCVVAVGVNCTAAPDVAPALRRIRSVTDLPLVAYPNGGGVWDGAANCWLGDNEAVASDADVAQWLALGVRLLGGCCGYGPAAIAALGASLG